MPGLVKQYEKEADKLAETLQKDRQEQENRVDRLGTEMTAALEQEIQEYEAYVAENGKRRQEIRALEPRSVEQIQRLEELIELSYEVEREIEEWEDDDDEDGDSEPDYESLWRPVRIGLENIQILPLSFVHGIQDKEKEGWLKQVEQLYQEECWDFWCRKGVRYQKRQQRWLHCLLKRKHMMREPEAEACRTIFW